jgi:hypothetical protein
MSSMGFNKRRMESERAGVAAKEAEARRALGRQILEDAERLVSAWNARQEAHMPMLFSPRSALRSPRAIGFCGCAAWRAALQRRLICARLIVIPTRR